MAYLVVKWLHILSSTLLFGTGLGSAYYLYFASRTRDPRVIAPVVRHVVIADWVFTTPTAVLQPVTGLYLAHLAGLPLTTPWILWSLVLYVVAGIAWLIVVWMQLRMRDLAVQAAHDARTLPDAYLSLLRGWVALGVIAFASLVIVYYMMVVKPELPTLPGLP